MTTMNINRLTRQSLAGAILVITALLLMSATQAEAAETQLAKQGSFSGLFGWTYTGAIHQIEEGHVFTHDIYKGTFFNDAGKGWLHETSLVCPAVGDLVNGKGTAKGCFVQTDKDGDKIFGEFNGTIDPATGFVGDWQYIEGTGKYTGVKGNGTFLAILIGPTMEGRSIIKGEWRLP